MLKYYEDYLLGKTLHIPTTYTVTEEEIIQMSAKWDPQPRPVLHPQQKLSGVETMHYRSYAETQEYLGRGDHQLKIRGLRIEAGEIEALLRGMAGIEDACVLGVPRVRPTRLAAYVISHAAPDTAALHDALAGDAGRLAFHARDDEDRPRRGHARGVSPAFPVVPT